MASVLISSVLISSVLYFKTILEVKRKAMCHCLLKVSLVLNFFLCFVDTFDLITS